MFCPKCGKEIMDEAVICPHCGCSPRTQSGGNVVGNQKSNVFAIVGFILSLCSIIPFISYLTNLPGLILSIVGLRKAPAYNGSGKKFAIAGIIISAILMVFGFIWTILLITGTAIFASSGLY